ncbi:MAG: hypothetical protein FWD41_02590 [Actinomycetia bacterium]|nr:hypothetical protein [Actinomycetes bacterium]
MGKRLLATLIIVMVIIMLIVSSLSLVGCNKDGANDEKEGSSTTGETQQMDGDPDTLVGFSYHFGSYWDGQWDFDITPVEGSEGAYLFRGLGSNGVDLDVEETVDQSVLDEIEAIIQEKDIAQWDGFSQRDESIKDGYGFSFKALYGDGSTIEADGYEVYPSNYKAGHDALKTYLVSYSSSFGTD